jgi:hypothetical protein
VVTIDALGSILGRDAGASEWNARDGRITVLGLHCTGDRTAGKYYDNEMPRMISTVRPGVVGIRDGRSPDGGSDAGP